ncbi:MAG: hypothetical protein AAGJ35_15245, partial [Myxococcota bacterium]
AVGDEVGGGAVGDSVGFEVVGNDVGSDVTGDAVGALEGCGVGTGGVVSGGAPPELSVTPAASKAPFTMNNDIANQDFG